MVLYFLRNSGVFFGLTKEHLVGMNCYFILVSWLLFAANPSFTWVLQSINFLDQKQLAIQLPLVS